MLTPRQKQLVQFSWTQVLPIRDTAASLFYDALFQLDPSLRSLFHGDMEAQKRKLMAAISAAVVGLDHLDQLAPHLMDMGRAHLKYGVRDEHYDTVGAAMLWTLERGLGEAWTLELSEAWTAAYGLIADTMRQGAAEALTA